MNNIIDSPASAWNDSISNIGNSDSSNGSDDLVLMPLTMFQTLVNGGPLQQESPSQHAQVMLIDLTVSSSGMHYSVSTTNETVASMVFGEHFPFVQVTNFMSSSILPTLSTFGPWAQGYGFQPPNLEMQLVLTVVDAETICVSSSIKRTESLGTLVISRNTWSIQMSAHETAQVPAPRSSVTITELPEEDVTFPADNSSDLQLFNMEMQDPTRNLPVALPDLVGFSSSKGQCKCAKTNALECVVSVCRSIRSNKYDGFKV